MKRTIVEDKMIRTARDAKFSDFTETELRPVHWSASASIEAAVSDGATNRHVILRVDGTPEEIEELRTRILDAFREVKAKYMKRIIR